MATLLSLERYLPPHRYDQEVVTGWVREWLSAPASPGALSHSRTQPVTTSWS